MSVTCPKCGYVRQPGDRAPDYECPRCGVVYAKVRPPPPPAPRPDPAPPETVAPPPAQPQVRPAIFQGKLKACPDCGGDISTEAATCPHCGCPVLLPLELPPAPVVVVDFQMTFGSMVNFMLKWALASIPAFIILVLFFAGVTAGLTAIFGGGR